MYSTAHARDRPSLGPNGNAPKYTQEARLHTRHGPTRDANSSSILSARRRRRPGRKVFRTLALCHARARRRPPHGSHCVAHDAASAQTARALGATQGAHAQQCDTAVGRRPRDSPLHCVRGASTDNWRKPTVQRWLRREAFLRQCLCSTQTRHAPSSSSFR